jgi:hypothetical protein
VNLNHTKKHLRIQGFDLDDSALREIGPWMRWPYVLCALLVTVAVALGSPTLIGTATVIALSTVVLPSHPFNYVYNSLIRRWTGTRPLPSSTPQGRFSCGFGGIWLAGTTVAFATGATTLGTVLGGLIAPIAILVAATHICIPSMLYNVLFDRQRT